MSATPRRITLLTDFRTADGYVASMRGVIASRAPHVLVEDASHEIAPGDVHGAAWALGRYWRLYPEGTIHVVVVDPGVGGARRALASACDGRFLVAPDNGVLSNVLMEVAAPQIVAIENDTAARHPIARTFHGRDVFAPAAAYLADGGPLNKLGPAVDDVVRIAQPEPERDGPTARGEVIHIDAFGNLITNLPRAWVGTNSEVWLAGTRIGPVRSTYSTVQSGQPLALIGSADLLEIALRDGSAARSLGVGRGAEVVLKVET